MGSRGRDRTHGQSLQLGWDGTEAPKSVQHAAQGTTGATGSAPPRMPSRRRRGLAIGAALLLVAALTVGLPRLLTTSDGPERAVTDFLQAMVDGDIDQVRALTEAASDASAAALTPEIMGGARGGIDSFEIQDVWTDGDSATVTALLHGGTSSQSVPFSLSAEAGSAFAPVHWALDPVPLPEFVIEVPFAVEGVMIDGVELPLEELFAGGSQMRPQFAVQLLPGSYELSFATTSSWVQSPVLSLEAPLLLGQWRKPVSGLLLELTQEAEQEVQGMVRGHLEDCLHRRSSGSDGCPELGEASGEVAWTLQGEPEVEYEAGWDGQLWSLHASATARPVADGTGTGEAESIPLSFYGTVYIDPEGELRFRPEDPGGGAPLSYAFCMDAETGRVTGVVMPEPGETLADWTAPCPDGG